MKKRIVVLISGGGSNLQAILDACANEQCAAEVVAVISNRPKVYGLERALAAGAKAITLDHTNFENRPAFDLALQDCIDQYDPDLVVLAGFMRILTPAFVNHYLGKLINIHPSLLPKYPGLHTHHRAIEAGDTHHGATVHFVTAELDGGPAIIQARVPIAPGDDETTLAQRVLEKEHIIYPMAVRWCIDGDVLLQNGQAILKGEVLPTEGFVLAETV